MLLLDKIFNTNNIELLGFELLGFELANFFFVIIITKQNWAWGDGSGPVYSHL